MPSVVRIKKQTSPWHLHHGRASGYTTVICINTTKTMKSKVHQNVMLWLHAVGCGYTYIMVPGNNVLRQRNLSKHSNSIITTPIQYFAHCTYDSSTCLTLIKAKTSTSYMVSLNFFNWTPCRTETFHIFTGPKCPFPQTGS